MKWFRFYNEALNDPKILRMPPALRWDWVTTLSVASINGGILPHVEDIALYMRKTVEEVEDLLSELVARELVDEVGDGLFAPHNWKNRQYLSDVSTERVKQHRKRKRNVSVTRPDTEAYTDPVANATAEPRAWLFAEGLTILIKLGLAEHRARPMIGRWLKDCGDDHERLKQIFLRAEKMAPADAIPWITQALKPNGKPNGKAPSAIMAAADNVIDYFERGGGEASQAAPRMLPNGRRE
jgi:hypothetical protein